MNAKKNFLFLILFLFPLTHTSAIFDSTFFSKTKKSSLPFFSNKEQKKELIKKQSKKIISFNKEFTKEGNKISEILQKIESSLTQAKKATEDPEKKFTEFLNKKITVLNKRKQALTNRLEYFDEIIKTINEHIDVIKEIIKFHDVDQQALKRIYSWKEFKDAEALYQELQNQKAQEATELKKLSDEKTKEKESINTLKQQLEAKSKEFEELASPLDDKEPGESEIKFSIVEQEQKLLEENINLTQTKLKLIDAKIILQDDEIDYLKHQIRRQQANLATIKKRSEVQINDVKIAKNDAVKSREIAVKEQEKFGLLLEPLKKEKIKLSLKKEQLTKQIRALEEQDNPELLDTVNYFIVKTNHKKVKSQFESTQSEVNLLQAKKDLFDITAKQLEVVHDRVSLSYQLEAKKEPLDPLIEKFKPLKQIAQNTLSNFQKAAQQAPVKTENIKKLEAQITEKKATIFNNNAREYQTCLKNLQETKRFQARQLSANNEYASIYESIIKLQEEIVKEYTSIISDLEKRKEYESIWKRSPKAISLEAFKQSLLDLEEFCRQLFWDTPSHLGPAAIMASIKKVDLEALIGIFLFFLLFFLLYACFRITLKFALNKAKHKLASDRKHLSFLSLNILISLIEFAITHLGILLFWIVVFFHIIFKFNYIFATINFLNSRYYIAIFHLISIPIFVYLSGSLLIQLKDLNKRLSFYFFAEKLQDRLILLLACFCYSTAVLLPLRYSFISYYGVDQPTMLPDVLFAAYSLILVTVLLLFFSKEDVLRLIPSRPSFLVWVKKHIDLHYYPVFFFLMGLLILSNPYIGYSNLAWRLAVKVPVSILLINMLFLAHYWIRKYSVFVFMKEEDEEIIDKFEHAKTYYGILVISTFLALMLATFILVARIWGYSYTPTDLWKLLTEVLVIPIGDRNKLGFIELTWLGGFITASFLISSLVHKFVLNKLFDILRTEPGMQNTFSKILHYLIILISTILGFTFIHLAHLLWYIGTSLAVAGGFAIKDIVADYVAGFFVLIERPLEIGNFVKIDRSPDLMGTVHKVDGRTTTIINRLNHAVIVPNKDLIMKQIDNWGKGRFAVGFEVIVMVDYRTDPDLARNTILEVIQANPTILRVPRIIVRLNDFTENALIYLSRSFISSRRVKEQWAIAAEIREEIVKAFYKKNIKFAFPQRVLHTGSDADGGTKPKGPITFNFDQ